MLELWLLPSNRFWMLMTAYFRPQAGISILSSVPIEHLAGSLVVSQPSLRNWRGTPIFPGLTCKSQILNSFNNTGETLYAHGKYLISPFFLTWKLRIVLPSFPPGHWGRHHQNFTWQQNSNSKEISATLSGPSGRSFPGLVDQQMTAFKHLCADEKLKSVQLILFNSLQPN